MDYVFAHADEVHEDIVEATSHNFEVDPLQAVLVTIVVAVLIVAAVQLLFKKPNVTIIVMLGLLFFVGVFAYSASALISAIAIIVGFVLSLILVFGGISSNN